MAEELNLRRRVEWLELRDRRLDAMVEQLASEFDRDFFCGMGDRIRRAWKGIANE